MKINRIEILRKYIDELILTMPDTQERRTIYLHLYGVSQACALLALRRGKNVELATMAGLLHDIYSFVKMQTLDHAHKGATLAREILVKLNITDQYETDVICNAIDNHSDKENTHAEFDEILIDADVLQHCLYHCTFEIKENEKKRFLQLKAELNLL